MKKHFLKPIALFLSMVLMLSVIPARAAQAKPAPPSWWPEEDYLIFEGDPIYTSDAWADILAVRQEVMDGVNIFSAKESPTYQELKNLELHKEYKTPGLYYEMALINIGVFCTGTKSKTMSASHYFFHAANILPEDHPFRRTLTIWDLRCGILDRELQDDSEYGLTYRDYRLAELDEKMTKYSITFADLRNHPLMSSISQADWDDNAAKLEQYLKDLPAKRAAEEAELEKRRKENEARAAAEAEAERNRVKIVLDNRELEHTDAQPCILNDRTMVPIYQLAQALGCEIAWNGETQTVTLTRASDTMKMTIGDKTAMVNGQPVAMDVAPSILEDRTMIPASYVAAFFGQKVEWDGQNRQVIITEDKSAAAGSNLEAWALPMGSMLSHLGKGQANRFGIYFRHPLTSQNCRDTLSRSWSVENREDLIETITSMTFSGHNSSFLYDAALVNSLSASEYKKLLADAEGMDAYMWPYTKQLSEKWGDRGILCWDLFRMSNLVQWGYTAGYLTYEEALALLEPAAVLLCENFSSWEEAYENYLDGYNWWARNDVLGKDVWQVERGPEYQKIKEKYGQIFDNSLFKTGVTPLPGLSIEDVVNTLPNA